MADPNLTQGVAAVVALLTGVAVGLCVDARRALDAVGRPRRWVGHALDVAAVAAMVPVVAVGLLLADWGDLRLYVLAAMTAGLVLYLAWGSPLILPLTVWLLRLLIRVARFAGRCLFWPARALARALRPPVRWLAALAAALRQHLPRRPAPPTPD